MHIDAVRVTEICPRLMLLGRRALARLTGRLYYFNGQKNRVRVFHAINDRVRFQNYVETGAFLGMTTDFLARTASKQNAVVYSCELDHRFFAIARRILGGRDNVHLHRGDSVAFLRTLRPRLSSAVNFVYLDAHGYDHLPLRDELVLLRQCPNTVVMIDDFRVPWDERFGWDKYGDDREICLRYIEDIIGADDVYLPSYPATHEAATYRGQASPRGYCVVAMSKELRRTLDGISLLRKASDPGVSARADPLPAQDV